MKKKLKYFLLIFILILSNLGLSSCKTKETYSVTISAKFGDVEISSNNLSSQVDNSIEYEPVYIVGYKFVGWEDNNEISTRTFDIKDKDKTYVAKYEMEFLETPVVIINTEDSKPIISKEDYVNCLITITNTKEEFELIEEVAGIRGRGNSTWDMEKKPYRIKFDSKQSLFGSSYKQKSWTLLANYSDKTMSRNAVAYEMAEQFDDIAFSSIHQFVEVYLNNEYLGVYLLCDQIQTGTGRVDIDEDLHEDGDTGYLIELDGRAPSEGRENIDYFEFMGNYYAIKTPDTEEDGFNADLYVNFIKNYLTDSMSNITDGDWNSVCNYIDVDSFVDTYIINELFYNPDVGWSSFYMYKDTNGKLCCGPVWDFDLAVDNHTGITPSIDKTLYSKENNIWFRNLFLHDEFKQLVLEKLESYEDKIFYCINLLDYNLETSYYEKYKNSLERNYKKWDIANPLRTPSSHVHIQTITGQMDYAREWLETRYGYMINLITNLEI